MDVRGDNAAGDGLTHGGAASVNAWAPAGAGGGAGVRAGRLRDRQRQHPRGTNEIDGMNINYSRQAPRKNRLVVPIMLLTLHA